jgi:uncharacterized protein (TIGR03435 family)
MKDRAEWRGLFLAAAGIMSLAVPVFLGLIAAPHLGAQSPPAQSPAIPQWQIAAGGKKTFDVASVKQNKSGLPPSGTGPSSNFPLNAGAAYSPSGGLFSGVNQPLYLYIVFAYKTTNYQNLYLLPRLPKWVTADRFDIEARAEGNPTKDQMRLMMQSLLSERFKLAVHIESRQLPVFALVLEKPGKMGPYLRPHSDNPPCAPSPAPGSAPPPTSVDGVYPEICGDILHPPSAPGRIRNAARDVTIGFIASSLTLVGMSNDVDRAVLDQTGLSGTFDFSLEWTPLLNGQPPGGAQVDMTGPTFLEALKDQLGLKLVPQTGPVDVLVIDHVEQPSEN